MEGHQKSLGEGGLRSQNFKQNWNFLGGGGGGGLKNKNLPWGGGGMDIFWNAQSTCTEVNSSVAHE